MFVKGLDLIIDAPRTLDSDAILAALMNSHSGLINDVDTTEQYGMSRVSETNPVPKTSFYPLLQITLLDDSKMIKRLTKLFRKSL